MENLKNSIILTIAEQKKNQNKSVDYLLDLPSKTLKDAQSLIVEVSMNQNIQEKLGLAYLISINPLSVKKDFIEIYNKFKDTGDFTGLNYMQEATFNNYISRLRELKVFLKFFANKFEESNIDNSQIKKSYNEILKPYDKMEEILKEIINISNKTEKFFKSYTSVIDSENIYEDYILYMGNSFNLISNIENIKEYTNFKYFNKEAYGDFVKLTEDAFKIISEKNEKYLPTTLYFSKYNEQKTDISEFIFNAEIKSKTINEGHFPPESNIKKYIYFKDNSSIIEYKNGNIENFQFGENESRSFLSKIEDEYLNCLLKKRPNYLKFFKSKKTSETSFKELTICIEMFLKNEQILKNSKINLIDLRDKSIESIYDLMINKEKEYKVDQMCRSILSNKYKDLINDSTKTIIGELYEKGVSTKNLQEFAGKKLALFKNSKELNIFLSNILDDLSEFSSEQLGQKLALMNIEPISTDDNIFIFEVKNFAQSKTLGSGSWCISRDQYYFDDYVNDLSKQYFIYDFNKSELDIESMIGVTLFNDGNFSSQHLKNDDYLDVNDYLKNIRKKIFDKKINDFTLSEDVALSYKEQTKKIIKNGLK